jgi:hypothetical protein
MPLHQSQFYLMQSLNNFYHIKEYLIRYRLGNSLLSYHIMLEVRQFGVLRTELTEVMRAVTV